MELIMFVKTVFLKLTEKVARFFSYTTDDLDLVTFQKLESKKYKKSGGSFYE
jgi:hypothetical protein